MHETIPNQVLTKMTQSYLYYSIYTKCVINKRMSVAYEEWILTDLPVVISHSDNESVA